MKFDVDWLGEHLEPTPDRDELAERLTACGFLVELRQPAGGSEVWDVEVTTNRPDAMNHRGLAREAAAATGASLAPLGEPPVESDEPAASLAGITISDPERCSRYVARIVRGVRPSHSPEWLKARLERCGVRPINAVVDATNYILLELGQPLHAFDLDRLAGRRIDVRRATAGETLETLDGVHRSLSDEVLVIASGERAVALAGIMGGADTEIGDDTTSVLIESAHFDPLTVRRGARSLGLHTEASHRFERGCDPEMAPLACDAAAALIARLVGGSVCRGRIDVVARPWQARRLELDSAALSRFAGLAISTADALRILGALGFEPAADGDRIVVSVPSHRIDVERVADLYEEVIRHVGYDAVPARLPMLATSPGRRHLNLEVVDRSRGAAVAAGFAEVVTWAFVDPADDGEVDSHPLCPGPAVALANPLAATQSTMRRSLATGLLAAARDNLNRGERSLALFEQGRVFSVSDGEVAERERIAVLLSGEGPEGREIGFLDFKGGLEHLLHAAGFPRLEWARSATLWLDPAEGAVLTSDGRRVGCAGLVATALADRWQIRQPVYLAELDLDGALAEPPLVRFRPPPKFPSVVADMTVEHPLALSFAELVDEVRRLAADEVERVELRDRFSGPPLTADRVRTTLRMIYRHPERSLTQDEVNADQMRLRAALAERLGVEFA